MGTARRHLIHCSYHKCLTVYFKRVMEGTFNRCLRWSGGYRHFNSEIEEFERGFGALRVSSINNRALDLARLGEFRVSRFIRDPRDLVVSGYHYHKRGAEPWTKIEAPTADDWAFANGRVPAALANEGCSYADYLRSAPLEEGLLAELEFRQDHFESMAAWPDEHPDILVLRYEDIVGDEVRAMERVFQFYGLSRLERAIARRFARRHALRGRSGDAHVRDPAAGQWRAVFTPRVRREAHDRYGGLIRALGYSLD